MSASLNPVSLGDAEYDQISRLVYHNIGLALGDSKRALVLSRLSRHLLNLKIPDFKAYLVHVMRSPQAFDEMISRITTHYTGFMRETVQFDLLRSQVLPRMVSERKEAKRLRIWSSACSSGEEVYSILLVLLDFFGGRFPKDWDIRILGTDIDRKSLKMAKAGLFHVDSLKTLSQDWADRYFQAHDERTVRFVAEEMGCLRFAYFNLMEAQYPFKDPMDLIFCRNVSIYFDNRGKEHLYRSLHRHLASDGFLFSGHAESLLRYPKLFVSVKRAIYQKKNDYTL